MYHVRIIWTDGQVTRATVNAKTLRGFRLSACRGCSIRITKVRP